MIQILKAFLAGAFLASALHAAEPNPATSPPAINAPTTLLTVYHMALQNNPQWAGWQETLKQANHQATIAAGQLRPQINFSASHDYYWIDSDTAQPPSFTNNQLSSLNACLINTNDYNFCLGQVSDDCVDDPACLIAQSGSNQSLDSTRVGVQLKQPLYTPETWYQNRQAVVKTQQTQNQVKQQQILFLNRLIQLYLNTLSAREQFEITKQEYQLNQQQLELLERLFEKGLKPASEVLYARAMLKLQASQLGEAQDTAHNSYAALENIAQQQISQLAKLDQTIPMPKPNPSHYAQWVEIARKHSPNIASQLNNITLAELEEKKRSGQRKPQVHLVAGLGLSREDNGADLNSGSTSSATLGVQVLMPLYAGGSIKGRLDEAASLKSQALTQRQTTEINLEQELRIAFNAAARGYEQLSFLDLALEALSLQVKQLEQSFEKGLTPAEAVLEARQTLFQTRQNRLLARYAYIRASVELKTLAGILNQNDIATIASWSNLDTTTTTERQQTLFDDAKSWLTY